MDFNKDYYAILDVPVSATKEQLKAAYRKLVKLHHPDKNPDDPKAEERIQAINEAYELLSNELTKHLYDDYRKKQDALKSAAKQPTVPPEAPEEASSKNRRTFYRSHIIRKEKRIFVKGTITVKFWGELLDEDSIYPEREINYKIHPTDVQVYIQQTDIHPLEKAPMDYQKSYKESELFQTPLPRPVHCIIQAAAGDERYDLELHDIRVKSPVLTNVTKHDGESFGTLTGLLFAFVQHFEEEEVQIKETECFGETGNVEFKEEQGYTFMQREFYNPDCTTYWNPWERIGSAKGFSGGTTPKQGPSSATTVSSKHTSWSGVSKRSYSVSTAEEGCAQYWWIPVWVLLCILVPGIGIGTLIAFAIWGLLYVVTLVLSRIRILLPLFALAFIGLILLAALRSGIHYTTFRPRATGHDTLTTTTQPVITRTKAKDGKKTIETVGDTLISHLVRWKDYDSLRYETTLSVLASQLRSSALAHASLGTYSPGSISEVYQYVEQEDEAKLGAVYTALDSIRVKGKMNDRQFANMVVSCIQSLPYYLVLDRSCNPDNYPDDEYIAGYLSECNRDCCTGNVSYGILSPVEFIGNLKGDCDTRSLLLYTVLKKFGYDVALLTSTYYKHALIAVHFPDNEPLGVAMNIHNKNYYLWETTSAGFQVGVISPQISNLKYWNISLLNENY